MAADSKGRARGGETRARPTEETRAPPDTYATGGMLEQHVELVTPQPDRLT